jgi:hypothetical protein
MLQVFSVAGQPDRSKAEQGPLRAGFLLLGPRKTP